MTSNYTPTAWNENTEPSLGPTNLNKIEAALVSALRQTGVGAGTYTLATIQVDNEGRVVSLSSGAPGAVADASTTVKGAAKMSVAPASPTSPIAVGDNDSRVAAATTSARGVSKTSVSPVTAGDPISISQNDPSLETRIEGLQLQWDSATGITVKTGAAWIPFLNRVYNVPSDIVKTGLATVANTWYHVFLFDSSGTPSVEVVTALPAAPYKGTARTKTSDTTRRYLGAIKANAAGTAILKFRWDSGVTYWLENANASPLLVLSNGLATTESPISCAGAAPLTCQSAQVSCAFTNSAGASVGNSEDNITLSNTVYVNRLYGNAGGAMAQTWLALDASQAFTYGFFGGAPTSGNGLEVRVVAYRDSR